MGRILVSSILFFLLSFCSIAQVPFDAISVEEVPIPPAIQAEIDLQTPGARCYRVYVCMNAPWWELISVFGYDTPGNNYPGFLTLQDPVGTRFYQNALCSEVSTGINPGFVPTFPAMAYDSFFTIKRLDNSPGNDLQITTGWTNDFETNGGEIDITDPVGGSWFLSMDRTVNYDGMGDTIPGSWSTSIINVPESDNRLLIAQLTTNGIFDAQFSLQFRQINTDYTTATPLNIQYIPNVTFTNLPGGPNDLPCSILFLPVELVNFDARKVGEQVNLEWVTESEQNNDYFTVERSKDGMSFEAIKTVDGAGNSQNRIFYTTIDSDPYEGISYYRLRQTDFNGYSEVTDMVAVEFIGDGAITIYPNPNTDGNIKISGSTESVREVRVFGADGKVKYRSNFIPGMQEFQLPLSNFSTGVYFVEFTHFNGNVERERLLLK